MEVAALVIGLIALLVSAVSVPSALQMFWGGPLLRFDFGELDGSDMKVFYCTIYNVPIQNRTLQKVGVRREPAVISVRFRICEAGSNRIVLDTAQAKLFDIANPESKGINCRDRC